MPAESRIKEDKDLINSLAVIIKTAQIHRPDNIAVVNAIRKFLIILNPMVSENKVTIDLVGEFFHLNNSRIRYSMDSIFNYDFLIREFKKRDIGTIVFEDVIGEEDIKSLLAVLTFSGSSETPFEALSKSIEGLQNISIGKIRKIKDENTEFDRKKIIKKNYFNAVSLTKGIANKISSGEKVSLKKAKRVIETIVDQIIDEESFLIGMTSIKDYDEYTYHHSVNVSIISVALGHRIGLTRKNLTELGLSALLHDIGKTEVPSEVLNKASEFTKEEWDIIMKHPIWGTCAILKLKGIAESSMSSAISAFEHHLNYDLSGYPKLKNKITLGLFSRIIAIADQYDAMTSSRVYSRTPMSPDRALSIMMDRAGTQLDPYLLKIFINMIGIYPLGSLVMLDTNEMGLVFESNPNQDFINRPRVLIIMDNKGEKTKNTVDLMEKNSEGNFKRSILKTLDPNVYKINLTEYLL
jgi:HD-GYP domain-containing protein (c-di-GMP phosphodiesterase class II)